MADHVDPPPQRSEQPATSRTNGNDTFDVLGTEIAALLRSTHEFSARTRSEADAEARARLADADQRAQTRLAEAEQQAQALLATASEHLAEADRLIDARLAAADDRAADTDRRHAAATTLLRDATSRVVHLEEQAERWVAESQAAVAELAAMRQALPRHDETDAPIDLRDGQPTTSTRSTDQAEGQPAEPTTKRKGKHKRRRQADRADVALVATSVAARPTNLGSPDR